MAPVLRATSGGEARAADAIRPPGALDEDAFPYGLKLGDPLPDGAVPYVTHLMATMAILARVGADEDVLAASAAFERARPWMPTYEQLDF